MTKSVSIDLHKDNDRGFCGNYWVLALISNASKIILNVRQCRLDRTTSIKVRDTQCGFARSKGTTNGIFLLKGVAETYYADKHLLHLAMLTLSTMHYCLQNCGFLVSKRMWCDCLRISTSTQMVSSIRNAEWRMRLRCQSECDKAVHCPLYSSASTPNVTCRCGMNAHHT